MLEYQRQSLYEPYRLQRGDEPSLTNIDFLCGKKMIIISVGQDNCEHGVCPQ